MLVVISIFLLVPAAGESRGNELDRVYLTRQMATEAKSFVKVVNNRAWQGTPIRVGGMTYKRGLGVHADSKLVFPLDGKFVAFHVVPGPDDAHHGRLEMKILVDDKEVFATGPTSSRDKTPRKALAIPVTDAQTLTLIVNQAAGDIHGDHASWADAWLERPGYDSSEVAEEPPGVTALPRQKLEPFLQEYCIDCHGKRKQEAQVRFDQISWEIKDNDTAQRWQDVLDQLNGGDMPPEDATQPFDDEMSAALDSLTGALLTARRRLTDHGGEIKMRRLNRREYFNTIRELFGFDIFVHDIPEDGESSSFDTVGSEQLFTSADFDRYLQLGRKIATESFDWNTRPYQSRKIERQNLGRGLAQSIRKKVAENEAKLKMIRQKKPFKEIGFSDIGNQEIFQRQFWVNTQLPKKYTQLPKVDDGRYLTGIHDLTANIRNWRSPDIRGDYIHRIHGGTTGKAEEIRKLVAIRDFRRYYKGALRINGTVEKPESVSIRLRGGDIDMKNQLVLTEELFNDRDNAYYRKVALGGDPQKLDPQWATIWVDWLEWEGPIYPEVRPWFEQIIYPDHSREGGRPELFRDEKAAELIEKFAFEAFRRRAPEPMYISGLHSLFEEYRSQGQSFDEAMAEVFAIILASPGFLYIQEDIPEVDSEGRYLDDLELAIRLSYFLWSRPPDRQLYAYAEAGGLSKPSILKSQIERMLDDPKARAFQEGFMNQWAELDRFDAITIDPKVYPRFNEAVRLAARQEPGEFFGTLIKEDLPVANLIESDFVTINSTLGAHYGIRLPNTETGVFQKVKLPADSPRGGLMTQAAFLTAGSNGERSSPVIRGALVMEKLLHDEPAPPPPNVPELGSATNEPKTNRQMVIAHQKQAVCASCHKKMDVIGFGLENFDTTGKWRDTEKVGDKDVAIEPGGTLPGGEAFANVKELKAVLLKNEDQLAKELVESILAYSLGRTIEFSDSDDVEELLSRLKPQKYRIRSMIREIAMSDLFRRK